MASVSCCLERKFPSVRAPVRSGKRQLLWKQEISGLCWLSEELINICGLSEGLIAIGFLFLFFQIICSCCQPGGVVAKCAWLTWPLSRKPFSCLSCSPEMSWDPLFGPSLDSTKALPAHNRMALQMKTHWREKFKVYTNQRAWTVGNSYLQWIGGGVFLWLARCRLFT